VLRDGGGLGAALAPHHTVPGTGEVATNALLRFLDLNTARVADWDSLPFALQYVARAFSPEAFGPAHLVTIVVVGALVVAAVAAVRGRRRRVVAAVAVLGVLVLLVVAVGLPGLLTYTRNHETLPVSGLNLVTGLAFLAALVGIAVLALRAPRRPRVASLVLLTVVAFLLTNKVYSPQYVLWLLPLIALARPRWRPFLVWQAAEALVLVTRYYYFAGASRAPASGLDLGWFVAAVGLRDVTLVVLAGFVLRDILRPERDDVRAEDPDGDDPAGGVLRGAEDQVWWGQRRSASVPSGRGAVRGEPGDGVVTEPESELEPESKPESESESDAADLRA
jgi:hypothetical protein